MASARAGGRGTLVASAPLHMSRLSTPEFWRARVGPPSSRGPALRRLAAQAASSSFPEESREAVACTFPQACCCPDHPQCVPGALQGVAWPLPPMALASPLTLQQPCRCT